ncbi:MAG: hypothetical protein PHS77_08950 [Gallionellaceae bacterium]|nr:hypothetical protein [Gallionellaceae bacterium]
MQPLTRSQQFWLTVLLTAWCLVGLTGRDAWKQDEALALVPLLDWLAGDGLVPTAYPVHTLLAGLTAWLAQPWLDLQDGARLANGLFTLAALACTGLAARTLYGPGYGAAAALALLGAFGLMLRAHAMLPETAMLAGYALLTYGVARARTGGGSAAIALATFMLALGRGLPDLVAAGLIVTLPMLSRDWRDRHYRTAVRRGLLGLAWLLAAWLGVLLLQGGDALAQWWQQFLASLLPGRSPASLLNNLSWFAWPVWPLALWTLWNEHRRLARVPALHPVLAAALVTLLLGLWPSASGSGLLPVLVPLALLAAYGLADLRRGAAQAFYWFGVLCFLFFAAAFWVYFAAIEWGWPVRLAARMARLVPDFPAGQTTTAMTVLAAAATLAWLVAIPLFPRAKARPILVWATGMTLAWFLLILLFKPWAEAGWGYRPQIRAMAAQLPPGACLRADVDPGMAVMLRLHLADRYRAEGDCDWWLLAGERQNLAAADWPVAAAWSGFRPRDRNRYYALIDARAVPPAPTDPEGGDGP